MSEAQVHLIQRLVGRFPRLEPLLREHLADNFGVLLPHVFFGDLTRQIVKEFRRFDQIGSEQELADTRSLQELLDELEQGFARGGEEAELIAVSFLENLPRPGEEGAGVRDLLGPTLRAELAQM